MGRVVFPEEVALALDSARCVGWQEVHLFLGVSSVSADSLQGHFGKEGIRPRDFDEAYPAVFLSQPSPLSDQETQHSASSLLGPRLKVS
jgi:hypothetical protein